MEPTVKPINLTDSSLSPVAPNAASADEIDAALAYENIFVPALFRHWPGYLITAAGVAPGERVLDIACGTGVLTRALPAIVGPRPPPVGLDLAPGMLEIARRLNPEIDWHQGDAVALPYDDASFDRVLCQFGLMFFGDRELALREMLRVAAPGGRIAVAVWDGLDGNPGFAEKISILDEIGGRHAGDALRAPFCLGDTRALRALAARAGLRDIELETHRREARFRSLREFVDAEVRGWLPVMGVHLDEGEIEAVYAECCRAFERHVAAADGSFALPMSAHIFSGAAA